MAPLRMSAQRGNLKRNILIAAGMFTFTALASAYTDASYVLKAEKAQQNYKVIFVLGGPGSGKGTACGRLEKFLGLHHISAGDELRAARDRGDATANLINSYINEGKIVPVEITCDLLKKAMGQTPVSLIDLRRGEKVFLIDGFPRNADNIDGWKASMAGRYNGTEKPSMKDVCVLHLVADEEEMTKRCLSRAQEQGRSDDNIETIRKRYHTYVQSTKPVIDRFRSEGLLIDINANQDEKAVYKDIEAALFQADPELKKRADTINSTDALLTGPSRHGSPSEAARFYASIWKKVIGVE